jgi:hypothetical protein
MNDLMRTAARSLEEQNFANKQIVEIIAMIQRNATGVEEAIGRQRAACDHLVASSTSRAAASRTTRDASAGLDGVADTIRERIAAIAGTAPGALANDPEPAWLTGGR